jgi:hypothetical protein
MICCTFELGDDGELRCDIQPFMQVVAEQLQPRVTNHTLKEAHDL